MACVYPVWMPWLHIGNGHYLFTAGDKLTKPAVDFTAYAECSTPQQAKPKGMIHASKLPEYTKVPLLSTSDWKPYEPTDTVTNTASLQYKLLHGKDVNISENGLVYIDDYLGAALGQRFGKIGDRFIFVLQRRDGTRHTVRVIMAEAKQYANTAGGNGWIGSNGHVMEILVDRNKLNIEVKESGSCNCLPELNGKIIRIYKEKR